MQMSRVLPLSQTGIQDWCLISRIGADQKNEIGVLYTGYFIVHYIIRTNIDSIPNGRHTLGVGHLSSDSGDFVWRRFFQLYSTKNQNVFFRQNNPQNFVRPMRNDDIRSDGVHDVDRFGFACFPRSGGEGIRLRGQSADRAKIDNVAGELRGEKFVDVRADLHSYSSSLSISWGNRRNRRADAVGGYGIIDDARRMRNPLNVN
uniref:Uncharacterized protein n=1 Tax=Romanomermis culicivorax TaxID=13658 RepID=A0A915KSA8_ROMCU